MTLQNMQALRRAEIWERLCRLSDQLMELSWLWWEEDPDMASWDIDHPEVASGGGEDSRPDDNDVPY
jgi:hypothetical protein